MESRKASPLRDLLVANYDDLTQVLTRRLGSLDRASDALQEAYARLAQNGEPSGIASPWHYLVRMAQNIGVDRWRADHRRVSAIEGWEYLNLMDDSPDPEREAMARRELEALTEIVKALPQRRRAIFVAAWFEELPHNEIAKRFNVSLRTIRQELQIAREFCSAKLRNQLRPLELRAALRIVNNSENENKIGEEARDEHLRHD
jgi:RNA polymerase sigma factor (sigma-70 family)